MSTAPPRLRVVLAFPADPDDKPLGPAAITTDMLMAAAGLGCATVPGIVGVLLTGLLIGTGTGLITPLGFAALVASTPPAQIGQSVGTAELGRELGDAVGPLLVAGDAPAATLGYGYVALAVVLAIGPLLGLAAIAAQVRDRWNPGLGPPPCKYAEDQLSTGCKVVRSTSLKIPMFLGKGGAR